MECCLGDAAYKAWERCPAIELFCKSAWTAQRQNCTTSIVGPAHGRGHVTVFSALAAWDFECDWQPLFRPMTRRRHSVNFSTNRGLRKKTESYAASHCVVWPAKVSRLLEPTWYRKSPLQRREFTGIRLAPRIPICLSRATFFLSPSPSQPCAAPLIAKASTPLSLHRFLTAHEPDSMSQGDFYLDYDPVPLSRASPAYRFTNFCMFSG